MSENPYTSPRHATDAPKRKWLRVGLKVFAFFGVGFLLLFLLLLPFARPGARPAARRSQCSNNLKIIAIALHNYKAEYHALPPAYTVDADGKPLHSWRSLILPFFEEIQNYENLSRGSRRLYEQIDLSKPWDDPANAEARNSYHPVFGCPSAGCPPLYTTYLASVAPGGCFRLTEPRRFSEISDGVSQTLMIIEAPSDRSVHWMSPNDADESLVLSIGPESKLAHANGSHFLLCDGSVRFYPADMPAAKRRALISIAGKDQIPEEY